LVDCVNLEVSVILTDLYISVFIWLKCAFHGLFYTVVCLSANLA